MRCALFFCCLCFSSAPPIDGVLAVVEREVILKSDVLQQTYLLASQKNIDPYKSPVLFESLFEYLISAPVLNTMTTPNITPTIGAVQPAIANAASDEPETLNES